MAILYGMWSKAAAPVVLGGVPAREEETTGCREVSVREQKEEQPDACGDDALVMHPVRSSNVQSVGYDAELLVLVVQFKNGLRYEYAGVEPEVHAGLMAADSVGGALGRIKNDYICRRVA